MNFSKYQFRASGLHNLMVNSRTKKDPLSQTTKTYLTELWIEEVFGRRKPDITGPAATKGTMVESDSLDLYKQVTGKTYFKNKTHLANSFITGTPDVIARGLIIDIKSSWSIWTFANVDEKYAAKQYYWQVLAYMWLTGKRRAELAFCLVNTPDEIMSDELYKLSFKFPEEEVDKFQNNYKFDDIDPSKRLKCFRFEYNQDDINNLKERITYARQYLNSLSLAGSFKPPQA